MAFYDRIAKKWHGLTGAQGGPLKRLVLNDFVLSRIPGISGLALLELGTGNGYFMPLVLRRFSGQVPARIVMTDHSPVLLNLAQRHFRVPNAEYKLLDVRSHYPFDDAKFDLVIANMVFNEIRAVGLKRAASECYRVLSPSGGLIGTVTHPDFVDSLSARGLLRRGPGGSLSMPGSDGLRLPVVRRSLREYLSIFEEAGFECSTENIFATPEVLNLKPGLNEVRDIPIALLLQASKGHVLPEPRGALSDHQDDTRWARIAKELPEFAEDIQVFAHLALLDNDSALNKIRFITEKVLHTLCRGQNVSWGQAEPTLERMIGPLLSAGVMPKNVGVHVRTIQGNVSPGSHYQESALSESHVRIAQSALVELLEWFHNSVYRCTARRIDGPGAAAIRAATVEVPMLAISSCPSPRVLQQLLLGQLPDPEAGELEQHFSRCDHCSQMVATLKLEDTFADALGCPEHSDEGQDQQVVQDLIGKIKELRPPETLSGEVTARPDAGPRREAYDFLAPAQGPGEIGRLGSYRVVKVLGVGGMGVVFQAEDLQLKRRVALKAIRPALETSDSVRQRFLREAQAAAAVKHDHIITVYQVGEDRGVPFLAMELLEGESLEERLLRQGRLPLAEVLCIARQVAEGLAAAHDRGLIHRDIKPSNLWLETLRGERGVSTPRYRVKILDFGLARAGGSDPHLTKWGDLLGTPAYMAPEQAERGPVDHRCDLFSLGCVLYRLCTGQLPFQGETALQVLAAVTMKEPRPPREINPDVPPVLDELVMRLLAKKPEDRPATAQAVADELAVIERGQASGGRPSSGPPRRRWPWAVAAAILLLAGGVAVQQYPQIILRITGKDGKVSEIRLDDPKQIEVIKGGKVVGEVPLPPEPQPPIAAGKPMGPLALVTQPAALPGVKSWTIETATPRIALSSRRCVAISPDSRTLAVGDLDGAIRLWDVESGRLLRVLVGADAALAGLDWSPDGKVLAAGTRMLTAGTYSGTVLLWDPAAGRILRTIALDKGVADLAWSPDGKYLALRAPGAGSPLQLWQAETAMLLPALSIPSSCFCWSSDSKALAVGRGKDIQVFDLASRKVLRTLQGHEGDVHALAWSPSGMVLASASTGDGTVRFWDPATGTAGRIFGGRPPADARQGWLYDRAVSLAWSPDGKLLATAGNQPKFDGATKVADGYGVAALDPASGQRRELWTEGAFAFTGLSWSSDGKTLAAANTEASLVRVTVHDTATSRTRFQLKGHPNWHPRVVWSPDGKRLFFGPYAWDLAAGRPQEGAKLLRGLYEPAAAISADGRVVATSDTRNVATSGPVTVRDGASLAPIITLKTKAVAVALSPDGKLAATGSGNAVQVWELASGRELRTLEGHAKLVRDLAWSPDGKLLASGSDDGMVRLWDTASWETARVLEGFRDRPGSLTWSPDGKALAVASWTDGGCRIWRSADGQLLQFVKARYGELRTLAWSAGGTAFTCVLADGTVRRWELGAATYRDLYKLHPIDFASFSPDGRLLAFAPHGYGGPVPVRWLCEAESGRPVGVLAPLRSGVWLTLSPEGHYRGSPGIEKEIVYVVQTDAGQQTLTPEEFAQKYNWKNDPERVRLTGR